MCALCSKKQLTKMKKKTGHFINVTNLDVLINICKSYETLYNPSKSSYAISALELLSTNSKSLLADVAAKELAYGKDTNERELLFDDLKRLSTRIMMGAKSVGVTKVHLDDLVGINRKIQGRRAVAITAEEKTLMVKQSKLNVDGALANPNVKLVKKNSVSQLSFDRLIDNFSKLIDLVKATPEYQPNEVDLQIHALTNKLDAMILSNQIVSLSAISLNKARYDRDNLLYLQENNLVDTALAVKNYTRSVFGARSVQNKQLSALRFTKLRK